MAGLLDESDSDHHSLKSNESDEEANLPSFAVLIASPPKKVKSEADSFPAKTTLLQAVKPPSGTPKASLVKPEPTLLPLEVSPVKASRDHEKAIKRTEKLANSMRKLSESTRMRKETTDKLESFKQKGGILGLSKQLEEGDSSDDESDPEPQRLSSNDSEATPPTEILKIESSDSTPSLPVLPPGRPLFVSPPSLINELYPPCAEATSEGGPLDNLERVLLSSDTTEGLTNVITSRWLELCYREKACPLAIWQWLYQIMCRSCDQVLSKGACTNLTSLVTLAKSRDDLGSVFCPSLIDVTEVLTCLGADLNSTSSGEDDNVFAPAPVVVDNLYQLIVYLKACVEACPQQYSLNELHRLVLLLASVSLDLHVCKEMMSYDIALCIGAIIDAIPPSDWARSKEQLSCDLALLCEHHHNNLYVCRLLTGTTVRLSELQMASCRKSIELLLRDRVPSTVTLSNPEFAKKVIMHYYKMNSPGYDYDMCYEMHSILAMMALFLNRCHVIWPNLKTKKDFAQLLGVLIDKVRDNDPNHPERGSVKDLLIRIKVEFDFDAQKETKQTDIRNCFR